MIEIVLKKKTYQKLFYMKNSSPAEFLDDSELVRKKLRPVENMEKRDFRKNCHF